MKKKVDSDAFSNEVAALRAMIGNIEPDEAHTRIEIQQTQSNANALNSQELKNIKDAIDRIPQLDELLQKILKYTMLC